MQLRSLFPAFVWAIAAFQPAIAQGPTLSGSVVEDSSDAPVAAAELKIRKPGVRELIADLETDGSGRLPGVKVPPGDYRAEVTRANFIAVTFPLHIPNTALRIRLVRYASIDGKVTNSNGQPVAGQIGRQFRFPGGGGAVGADVGGTSVEALLKQPDTDEFRPLREAGVEKDGTYHLQELPPGQYQLRLTYFGIQEGAGTQLYPDSANPRVFELAGSEALTDLNFVVPPRPAYKVSGTVQMPSSRATFQLSLASPDQPEMVIGRAMTGEGGVFDFDNVPSGAWDLFVSGFNSQGVNEPLFARQRIQVGGTDLAGLVVPVSPGKSLSIVLRAHGSEQMPAACPPAAGVALTPLELWRWNNTPTVAQASIGKPQSVAGLAPGRFRLSVTGLGNGCYSVTEPIVDLSRDEGQPVALELIAAGSITGTLHNAAAAVLLDAGSAAEVIGGSRVEKPATTRLAYPDNQGRYTFDDLRPGHYRIAAVSDSRWIHDLSRVKIVQVTGGAATTADLDGGAK